MLEVRTQQRRFLEALAAVSGRVGARQTVDPRTITI
jgi:hypothetical protein